MLTKLRIRNFKQFDDVEIELGQNVVFIGPNNSGKTTALQALMLWYVGIQEWIHTVSDNITPPNSELDNTQAINRLNLLAIPIPQTDYLWRNRKVKNSQEIVIEIIVDGIENNGEAWSHGYRFSHINEESLICEHSSESHQQFYIDDSPSLIFLPAMSGLITTENLLQRGAINRLVGEGRTAEILRNICLNVYDKGENWQKLVNTMKQHFAIEILAPQYRVGLGDIRIEYIDRNGIKFELMSAGRGMLQVLLLLAYLYDNPNSVILLDEPDAHLEILRQREIYELLVTIARETASQIIIATHSEVILNEAAKKDVVIAFTGIPHRINKHEDVKKSLTDIGYEYYVLAQQRNWVLYLEGSTDLDILRQFAQALHHLAAQHLLSPCVKYVSNVEKHAHNHFDDLREAFPHLHGLVIFDRLNQPPQMKKGLQALFWRRYEIENYLCQPITLETYAQREFGDTGKQFMTAWLQEHVAPIALKNFGYSYWQDTKISTAFLEPLFDDFFAELGLPNLMRKSNFHVLAHYVPVELIDPEVVEKLDAIVAVAEQAQPG